MLSREFTEPQIRINLARVVAPLTLELLDGDHSGIVTGFVAHVEKAGGDVELAARAFYGAPAYRAADVGNLLVTLEAWMRAEGYAE
jgi:hypothetical protein